MKKERDPERKKRKRGFNLKDRELFDEDLNTDDEISRQKKSGVRFHRKRTLKDEVYGK